MLLRFGIKECPIAVSSEVGGHGFASLETMLSKRIRLRGDARRLKDCPMTVDSFLFLHCGNEFFKRDDRWDKIECLMKIIIILMIFIVYRCKQRRYFFVSVIYEVFACIFFIIFLFSTLLFDLEIVQRISIFFLDRINIIDLF